MTTPNPALVPAYAYPANADRDENVVTVPARDLRINVDFTIPESGPGKGTILFSGPDGQQFEVAGDWMDLLHLATAINNHVRDENYRKSSQANAIRKTRNSR